MNINKRIQNIKNETGLLCYICGGGAIITIIIINFVFCFDASSMYSYVE